MSIHPKDVDQFMSRVHEEPNTGCWLWMGSVHGIGYGKFRMNGHYVQAHRVSWQIHNGDDPGGLMVLHKCDVKLCVNPEHLFLGTHLDNMADMVNKGRSTRGIKNPNAKLNDEKVLEIRRRARGGETHKSLSVEFGVVETVICKAVNRETWRHVNP